MSEASLPSPVLIQAQAKLLRMVGELSAQPIIAIDTESNSLHAYRERVCLIQFSIPGKDYLVDPLAIPDLESLGSILASREIEKVLHGAEYDVIGLKRDFRFDFRNLFDTRMAIRTLGGAETSLQKLLEMEFGVQLNKRFQRANWGKRPLTPELLNYACLDTHYLLPLRQRLAAALQETGRWEENAEACAYIALLKPSTNSFDTQGFWQIHNARKLNARQAAILRELWIFRDGVARDKDVPLFKVLEDKVLLSVARTMPRRLSDLGDVPGLTAGLQRRLGTRLLEIVEQGTKAPPATPPHHKRIPDDVHSRYDRLRQWRMRVAKKRGLSSDIILPRDVLWDIAHHAPKDHEELRKLLMPLEWRLQKYGGEILDLLKN